MTAAHHLTKPRRIGAVIVLAVAVGTAGAAAALQQVEFRANDGTAYQVLRTMPPLTAGADGDRVTTIGGALGIGACNITQSGSTAAAIGGVLPPSQALHPYASILRTTVLDPNDINSVSFSAGGAGQVTLGTGVGAIHICRDAADCPGGTSEPLVGLASTDAKVPAACIANGLQAQCDNGNSRNAFAFGLAASGSPPVCTNPAAVTVNTTVCAAQPGDGFSLALDEAIVFVYDSSLQGLGFGVAAGGFSVDTNAIGSSCPHGGVLAAAARLDSQPAPGGAATAIATATQTPGPEHPAPASSPPLLLIIAAALVLWGMLRLSRSE